MLLTTQCNCNKSSSMENPPSDADWSSKESIRQRDNEMYFKLKIRIENGVEINEVTFGEDEYPLIVSLADQGYTNTFKLVLSVSGVDIDATNNKGQTAFDVADNNEIKELWLDAKKGVFPTMLRSGVQER